MSSQISIDAIIEPLNKFDAGIPMVDTKTGLLTEYGLQMMQQFRDFVSGTARLVPCEMSVSDHILVLTATSTAPKIDDYRSHDIYVAGGALSVAEITELGEALMAQVSFPEGLTLPELRVILADGTDAYPGGLGSNSVYLFIYSDHADGGDGGFILK